MVDELTRAVERNLAVLVIDRNVSIVILFDGKIKCEISSKVVHV